MRGRQPPLVVRFSLCDSLGEAQRNKKKGTDGERKKREGAEEEDRESKRRKGERNRQEESLSESSNLWTGLFIAPVGAGFTRSPITEIYDPSLAHDRGPSF